MDELAMCRVCLAEDVRLLLIANTHLQEMYESLTLLPLETKDSRPIRVCYICCAELQNSYRLRKRCLQSEELFTQILSSGGLQPLNVQEGCTQRLVVEHPVIHLSIGDVHTNDDTTEDSAHRSEATDVVDHDPVKQQDSEVLTDIKMEPQEEHDAQIDDNIQCSHLYNPLVVTKREPDDVETDAEDIKIEEDMTIEENEPYGGYQFSLSAYNIYPKIEKLVLKRMVLNDTIPATGVPALKKTDPLLVTKRDTVDKVDATLHTRTHTGEKRFTCDVCNKRFTLKYNLTQHMSIHTGEKRFHCKVCNKSFRCKDNLSQHMYTHTDEKRFPCDVCNKRFKHKHHLTRHMFIHTGEKLFQCNLCNKSFHCKENLTQHMYTHTGEKRFLCDVCNKRFTHKYKLTLHMSIHTGEKRFQCNLCNKSFRSKDYLKQHVQTH